MKNKVIRLTESDLARIVKRILTESKEIKIGNTINGVVNPNGNRPINISVEIISVNSDGTYSGELTEWGFHKDYGVEVGDEVKVTKVEKLGTENAKCYITPSTGNIGEVILHYCEIK